MDPHHAPPYRKTVKELKFEDSDCPHCAHTLDLPTMRENISAHLIIAAVAVALVVSCKAPPFPKPDVGQQAPPEQPQPAAGPAKPVQAEAGPAGSMTANIGDVQRGTWASHVFKIKNDLDRVMHVKNVRGS